MSKNEGYIRIPIAILGDSRLKDADKLVLIVVIGLNWKFGYCWATNKYIGKILSKQLNTISSSVNRLANLNLITTQIDQANGNTRKLSLNLKEVYKNSVIDATNLEDRATGGSGGALRKNGTVSTAEYKILNRDKEYVEGSNESLISKQDQRDLVRWLCDLLGIKGFPNYGKQAKAIYDCLKVDYTIDDIKSAAKQMNDDSFWSSKGFDFTSISNQLPKLDAKKGAEEAARPKFDNPDWI